MQTRSLLAVMSSLLAVCLLSGCVAGCSSFASFVEQLEQRQLKSCIEYALVAGGGFGGSAQGSFRGITVTGGADMLECQVYWRGGP